MPLLPTPSSFIPPIGSTLGNTSSPFVDNQIIFPEDTERFDIEHIQQMANAYFDKAYPEFEPEIISTFEKQYYLPALKVLRKINGDFCSPSFTSIWTNGELEARCEKSPAWFFTDYKDQQEHDVPCLDCSCGIYGSVNLQEIAGYNDVGNYDYISSSVELSLCIIEPSEGANVILCRKGWRASRAFISEIIGETISIEDASRLLSIAWNRSIDVWRCYENRQSH